MNKIIMLGIVLLISINISLALEIKINSQSQQDIDTISPESEIIIQAISEQDQAEVTLLFNGQEEIFKDIMEKTDQGFEYNFKIPKTMKKGDYTIIVNDGDDEALKDIRITEIVSMEFIDSSNEKLKELKQDQENLKTELEEKGYSPSLIKKMLIIFENIWRNYIAI